MRGRGISMLLFRYLHLVALFIVFANSVNAQGRAWSVPPGMPSGRPPGERAMPRYWTNDSDAELFKTSSILLKTLFSDYLDSRPRNGNGTSALFVLINARVLRLLDVDELRQVLSFSAKVELVWKDDRLRWDPAKFSNLRRIEVPQSVSIWIPDVTWHERLEVDFMWRIQGRVMLNSDGYLRLYAQVLMNINCYMDPGYFPFDSHRCTLTFEPLVHTNKEVILVTVLTEGLHNQSLANDHWQFRLLQTTCATQTHAYALTKDRTEEFTETQCTLLAQRRPLYHLFNLFLPAAVITFMTVFAFFIPPTEPDMKIQFSLLVMLQLIVFLMYIYDSMPISATQIPLLSLFFAICLVQVACSCCMTVIISYVHWLGEDNIAMPTALRRLSTQKLAPLFAKHHLSAFHRVKNTASASFVSASTSTNHNLPARASFRRQSIAGIFRLSSTRRPFSQVVQHIGVGDIKEKIRASEIPLKDHRVGADNEKFRASKQTTDGCMSMEDEWSLNKAEWSLASVVLDRVCAVCFIFAYVVIVSTILLVGYNAPVQ